MKKMEKKSKTITAAELKLRFTAIAAVSAILAEIFVNVTEKFSGISHTLSIAILILAGILVTLNLVRQLTNHGRIYLYLKRSLVIIVAISASLFILLVAWYGICFFPDDQTYLDNIAKSVHYEGSAHERIDTDLIRSIDSATFSSPLTAADRTMLLSADRAASDVYIDTDPYAKSSSPNSLKYSTGRIFYYIYQKKSIVIRGNSTASYPVARGTRRFLSFDAVVPPLAAYDKEFTVNVYHTDGKRTLLLSRKIKQEQKPKVYPFRYSNLIKSLLFYIKHPARSVLTDYNGWENVRVAIPDKAGKIEIEFIDPTGQNFLCAGSPKIFKTDAPGEKKRLRIAYFLFDTLAKQDIDVYEYPKLFSGTSPDNAVKTLGSARALTPNIDQYAQTACLFNRLYSVGQVTRPSIVPLWTSKPYAIERMPVFRNIVTKDNKDEFHDKGIPSVPDTLSKIGYLTKQISCNAEGHAVSGVGVDLGFDENYDYTLEASEHTENMRKIIDFFQENQNRDFLLYAHINVPHPPHWIPLSYYISALWYTNFHHNAAVSRANIRYLDDCFGKVMKAVHKLKIDEDTIIIIAADHTGLPDSLIRGLDSESLSSSFPGRESQLIATFFSRSVYNRPGSVDLYDTTMNIPWFVILPTKEKMKPGFVDAVVSTLDVGPTFIDLASAKPNTAFDGKSFKSLFYDTTGRKKILATRIPMIGRFENGLLIDGRYKYWQNIEGVYKYRDDGNEKKYLVQQEYLFDHQNDPWETKNLALDMQNPRLLDFARKEFAKNYVDYPDKNFLQFTPSVGKKPMHYRVSIVSGGKTIYPRIYGNGLSYKVKGIHEIELTANVTDKTLFSSFETDPPDATITITVYRDGKQIPRSEIFSAVEDINIFKNPIEIRNNTDRYAARIPARTGLEELRHPGAISYYRIPLIYWLELNTSEQDIKLSPGIKEVLRGWGYIQ